MSLKRITMAGSGEWADSWLLLAHREPPEVDAGSLKLTLEVGSRQWGGTTWDLDLEIGRFDEDTGTHDGEITWDIQRASGDSASGKATASREKAESRILDTLADHTWELTKSQVKQIVGGNKDASRMRSARCAEGRNRPQRTGSNRGRNHEEASPVGGLRQQGPNRTAQVGQTMSSNGLTRWTNNRGQPLAHVVSPGSLDPGPPTKVGQGTPIGRPSLVDFNDDRNVRSN